MPKLNNRIPKYRKHRISGQAVVTLNGRDHYLGPHGTEVSRREYDRLITEWLARSRRPESQVTTEPRASTTTINEMILGFWSHAEKHYRKPDGTHTSELTIYRQALRQLRQLYGHTFVSDFGPKSLKALQEHFIRIGWCRNYVNSQINRTRHVFRWAASEELIPASIHQALKTVSGLQRGRTEARESEPVSPAPDHLIAAIQPFVSRQVWAMIQIQLATGSRPGEIVRLRLMDLDMGRDIWVSRPTDHKTAHHGHAKAIYFGPRAQEIIRPFIAGRPTDMPLFSPVEAESERRAKLAAKRKTPRSYGNRPGTNRKANPKRSPGRAYNVCEYATAIERGCRAAFPPPEHLAKIRVAGHKGTRWESDKEWKARLGDKPWADLQAWRRDHHFHPHQLRHNAATRIQSEFGIEAARVILGHKTLSITTLYAEMDYKKAEEVVKKIG